MRGSEQTNGQVEEGRRLLECERSEVFQETQGSGGHSTMRALFPAEPRRFALC